MPKETRSIFLMTFINGLILLGVLFVLGFFDEESQAYDNGKVVDYVNVETYDMLVENNILDNNPTNVKYDNDKLKSFIIDSDKGMVEIKIKDVDNVSKQKINEQYNDVYEFINKSNKSKSKRENVKYVIAASILALIISFSITIGFRMRV